MIPFENIAIIGSGNVACTYAKVLKNNGVGLKYILIRNQNKIKEIKTKNKCLILGTECPYSFEEHPETNPLFDVELISDYEKLYLCDLIIIAVNDDAIGEVASKLPNYKGVLVHTSGTQDSAILQCADNYGVIYPLQTLSKDYPVDFKSVPVLINASSREVRVKLRCLAEMMSDMVFDCSDEDRRYIHMNAVYVSNFVNVMLQIGNKLLEEKSFDISILESLVKETVNKAFRMGAEKALTGPARRGDMETINKHLQLLDNNREEREIYQLLTNYILNKYKI